MVPDHPGVRMRTLQGLDLSRFFFAVLRCTSFKFSLTAMNNIAAMLRISNPLFYNLVMTLHRIFHPIDYPS